MSVDEFESDDFLRDAFALKQANASNESLRIAVLTQTTGVIRNRRRLRRAGIAAALVGCYLAGMATVSLWRSSSPIDSPVGGLAERIATPSDGKGVVPAHKPVRPEDDQIVDSQTLSALAKLTPYDRLRQAGDRLLEENGDIPAAMRSYKRALQVASVDERSLAPDQDSWLLMAVKNSSHEN